MNLPKEFDELFGYELHRTLTRGHIACWFVRYRTPDGCAAKFSLGVYDPRVVHEIFEWWQLLGQDGVDLWVHERQAKGRTGTLDRHTTSEARASIGSPDNS